MLRRTFLAAAPVFAEVVNVPAPDLSIKMENGQVVKLSSFKGKPLMIEVFSTTCPSCQAMASVIDKTYKKYGPKGAQFLAVINDESQRTDFARFRKEHGATYPLGIISREDSYRLLSLSVMRPFSYPASAFIDRNGVIRERHSGVMDLVTLPRSIEAILRR